MLDDLLPGSRFPDLDLPDHAGTKLRLTELAGDDPIMLHFFRGWWCPKEQAFFRHLVALQDEADAAYTRFVSVSIDPSEVQAAFRAGIGARWIFLSDAERNWIDRLELVEKSDTAHRPYLPTVFTLRPDLTIHAAYHGYWFWERPTTEELRQDFRAISRLSHPDRERPSA